MGVISSENVYAIIRKTLSIINPKIIEHGEITGYILYKMLECEQIYTMQDLLDYTMIGILHDLGMYKEGYISDLIDFEETNVYPHSIYGFLFLKYFSPMDDKAEIVLYHHVDYNRHSQIYSKFKNIIECLTLADQVDNYMSKGKDKTDVSFFVSQREVKFSGRSLDLFFKAEHKYGIMANLRSGEYKKELSQLLAQKVFSEKYKKSFLEMLVYTIDFRSEHTVVHSMSTVNFAEQLGRLLHLSAKDLRDIYYGALLHDLGKIAIPIEILESTGRLSEEEMKVMKAHVRITEMILAGIVSDEVLEIACRHHEKLDGSGYHKGLKQEDLTIPQQVVAVADVLSALYGKRSYKESFDSDMIKQILMEEAAHNKINAKVVDSLMKNYDRVIHVYETKKEATIGLYLEIKRQYGETLLKFEGTLQK